jgi:ZIP family zinc transporter
MVNNGVRSAVVFFFKKLNKKVLDGMLGFAAGVMIAASFWSLLEPGIELAEKMGMNEWLIASLGFCFRGNINFYYR